MLQGIVRGITVDHLISIASRHADKDNALCVDACTQFNFFSFFFLSRKTITLA